MSVNEAAEAIIRGTAYDEGDKFNTVYMVGNTAAGKRFNN